MSQLVVFIAGLLLVAESQASDVADRSTLQGFLPKHDKFITPNFNSAKPQVAAWEEKQAVQELPATGSNDPISLSIFGIGLVSFVTMLGLTLRRALQPATIPTNSGGLDVPMMEMKSQPTLGWGQLSSQNTGPSTLCYASKEEMVALAESNPDFLGRTIGFWDPFNLIEEGDFWGLGNEATIGYLRHAEIKHGRIAMAGFLGFFVQSPGNFIGDIVSGDHAILPYRGYVAGCTPQEQWANIPMIGKLQILTAVGMLESYGEGAGFPESYTHYTKGGQPGYYPPIKGKGGPFKQILLDLYDPLGFGFRDMSAADKKKGLFAEINNGRMAMIGLFSVLAESAVPGSNPQYKILNIDMPTSDVDIMGSVIPQLTSPFALKAYPVLAVCALVQQQRSLKN